MKAMGGRGAPAGSLPPNAADAAKVGVMSDAELKQLVDDWRKTSPMIPRLWYQFENAAMNVIRTSVPEQVRGLVLRYEGVPRFLTIELPSGRKLFYANPFFGRNRFGIESISPRFMHCSPKNSHIS